MADYIEVVVDGVTIEGRSWQPLENYRVGGQPQNNNPINFINMHGATLENFDPKIITINELISVGNWQMGKYVLIRSVYTHGQPLTYEWMGIVAEIGRSDTALATMREAVIKFAQENAQ